MQSEPVLLEQNFDNPVTESFNQAEFIKNEIQMSNEVDLNDPLTKSTLIDHPEDVWIDILGNGQLEKKVITPGEKNSRPNKTDICTLKLIGKLEDGTVIEDYEELKIQLGDLEVVQGLDLAIALMDTGEEAEIKVASRFAYGDLGRPTYSNFPAIPPKSNIFYNVTLKTVDLEPEPESLSISERRQVGNSKRERGNWWFSRDECTLAMQCYRRALEYLLPSTDSEMQASEQMPKQTQTPSDADLQGLLEDSLKVHNNLAATQLKVQAYDAALSNVDQVLRCQPKNVKALFRKGKILHHKGEHAKACTVLIQALTIEPDNKAIQQELSILRQKKSKDVLHEKNLYKKMLGTTDNRKSSKRKGEKYQIETLKWGMVGGTIAAIIGLIIYRFST